MSSDASFLQSTRIDSRGARVVSRVFAAGGAALIAVTVADTLAAQVVVVAVLALVFTVVLGVLYNRVFA
ncbi:hypothetical protein SAMN05216226_11355 [Halovenus aranensis]|jgi:hypothetical protein|uniref:Uncharacterized protein n=1 Tax=Halovenus aranensis TaxID=890420 RepID=A0A1G8Y3B7_9EURY|nr:hypothetical protein [Halovenus aranensis]SDJ97271.1 hypothetical protein SAMN05216226_11355 [Halovenus aranensis]